MSWNPSIKKMRAVTSLRGWLTVGAVYALALAISARNYYHWGPDARYYLAMTYRYSGMSEHDAGQRTYEYFGRFPWFKDYCYLACDPGAPEAYFGHLFHGEVGGMVATRVVYPALSVPFVWLFGPQGMLVVPFLAYTAAIVMIMFLVARLAGGHWPVLAGVAMIVPTAVSSYALYTYTEALAVALVLGCLLTMPLSRRATRRDVLVFGAVLTLMAFTRQFHYVVVAAVGSAWLSAAVFDRRLRNAWLPFLTASVVVVVVASVAQTLAGPDYSALKLFMAETGISTTEQVPLAAAKVAYRLAKQELYGMTSDLALAIVCMFAGFGVFRRFREPIAALVAGAVLGTMLLNVLNTTYTQFRYYVTAFPFIALMATLVFAGLVRKPATAFELPRQRLGEDRLESPSSSDRTASVER